jgi:hypothetical protein
MSPSLATATIVAGFWIQSLIGEERHGSRLYRADEVETGRHVALKLLSPNLARDERFRQRC